MNRTCSSLPPGYLHGAFLPLYPSVSSLSFRSDPDPSSTVSSVLFFDRSSGNPFLVSERRVVIPSILIEFFTSRPLPLE